MTNALSENVTNQDPLTPRSSDAPGSQPYPWLATEEQIDWEQRSKDQNKAQRDWIEAGLERERRDFRPSPLWRFRCLIARALRTIANRFDGTPTFPSAVGDTLNTPKEIPQ
jgi:hypothetical protein